MKKYILFVICLVVSGCTNATPDLDQSSSYEIYYNPPFGFYYAPYLNIVDEGNMLDVEYPSKSDFPVCNHQEIDKNFIFVCRQDPYGDKILIFTHDSEYVLLEGSKGKQDYLYILDTVFVPPQTYDHIAYDYYKSDRGIFYKDYYGTYRLVRGADSETFTVLDQGYAKDKNHMYLDGKIAEDSVVEGNIYKNNLYGFQFVLPKGANLNTDKRVEGVEDYDPLYYISLHLGDSINTNIDVYHKDARIKDVESDYTEYHMVESDQDRGVEVWENGPAQGPANWWFLNTFLFGEKYAIKIETSNDEQSEDFFEKHAELVDSFEFSEEF